MKICLKTILIVLCVLFSAAQNLCAQSVLPFRERPPGEQWIYDYADLISDESEQRINTFLRLFFEETGMEFVAVSLRNLQDFQGAEVDVNDVDFLISELFYHWRIGSRAEGAKGLFFVVVEEEKYTRLEVGSDLEGIYTDAFVGYIQREQMKPFFEQGRVGDGFEATLEYIVDRAHASIKSGSYDLNKKVGLGSKDYLSGGGGAHQEVDIGSLVKPVKPHLDDGDKSFFHAQATPKETLAKYFEALRRHIKDPDLDIYTDETKEFFRQWTVTNAQQEAELRQMESAVAMIKEEGDYAVMYYPDKDKTYNPYFLRKSHHGWRLDFATMMRVIRFNHRNEWHFVSYDHPYMFAFSSYNIDKNGFVWFKNSQESRRGYININFSCCALPIRIEYVEPGGAAYLAGVQSEDLITHVNGQSVESLGFQPAFRAIANGPIGSILQLRIYRPATDQTIDFKIKRTESVLE